MCARRPLNHNFLFFWQNVNVYFACLSVAHRCPVAYWFIYLPILWLWSDRLWSGWLFQKPRSLVGRKTVTFTVTMQCYNVSSIDCIILTLGIWAADWQAFRHRYVARLQYYVAASYSLSKFGHFEMISLPRLSIFQTSHVSALHRTTTVPLQIVRGRAGREGLEAIR